MLRDHWCPRTRLVYLGMLYIFAKALRQNKACKQSKDYDIFKNGLEIVQKMLLESGNIRDIRNLDKIFRKQKECHIYATSGV